ncbi:MAG: NADH-quinone oxidoreductase subunit L [Puniceicoccales bacterium]|jgi:NADH-quinone oxidoreductase subunit L|nr:NADH-quinone oxidoreductase subunit L [Puniceicoccales bacterium]
MSCDFSSPQTLLSTLLLAPLGAAAVSGLLFRRSRWGAPILSCTAALVVLVCSLKLLLTLDITQGAYHFSLPWLELGNFKLNIGFLIDQNAATMLFVVSFVAFWIHIFSVGYMDDDEARGRFFTGLSIFMFSILGIVVADNLFMTFIFWELVGFSSYMLIAHYWDKDYAAMASKKAFITNRVGDLGFLIGIILCQWTYGTVSLTELSAQSVAPQTIIGFLLMCGFLGKSAQFPLHVWLTDAMAGPTPVSALIHAATMVAAGVYFMVRVYFLMTPLVLDVMLWSCAGMAVLAGFCALGQTDIKKSLAYSTLSHLGFMGAAIGLRVPEIALLHMAMHAFFKATLFLCSGSVIHACHHEQDMTKMGGLAKKMPITFAAFLVAGLSICAFPLLAGWYSKDMILSAALLSKNYPALILLVLAALGSALYTGRMLQMVFFGKPNSEHAEHAHESNLWMTLPLIVLGVIYSLGAGWSLMGEKVAWLGGKFLGLLPAVSVASFADKYNELHHQLAENGQVTLMLIVGIVILLVGMGGAFLFYKTVRGADALQTRMPKLYFVLEYRWMDTLYNAYIAKIQQPLANMIGFFDTLFINGLAVRGVGGGIPGLFSLLSRRLLHTGNLHNYVFWFALGALFYGAALIVDWSTFFCGGTCGQ